RPDTKPEMPTSMAVAMISLVVSLVMVQLVLSRVSAAPAAIRSSNSLRKFDRSPATGADRRRQQRVADCIGRACETSRVAMLKLVGLEAGDIAGKFWILFAELRQLFRIMLVDLRFDSIGTGECRFLGHQRGGSTEREAGD